MPFLFQKKKALESHCSSALISNTKKNSAELQCDSNAFFWTPPVYIFLAASYAIRNLQKSFCGAFPQTETVMKLPFLQFWTLIIDLSSKKLET